jgi:hypothetical protein
MMIGKRKSIPSEYRETEDLEQQIRANHRTIFTLTADGLLRPSETYVADMIKKLY